MEETTWQGDTWTVNGPYWRTPAMTPEERERIYEQIRRWRNSGRARSGQVVTVPEPPASFPPTSLLSALTADPVFGLLWALKVPAERENDERNAWGKALETARDKGDSLPFLAFADWCDEREYDQWSRIARTEGNRLKGGRVT